MSLRLSPAVNPFQTVRPSSMASLQAAAFPLHTALNKAQSSETAWGSAPANAYHGMHPGLLFGAKRKSAVSNAKEPLLATEVEMSKVRYPVYISPKVDGNRGMVQNGVLLGRGLVPIPNPFVQSILARPELEGFDGELICGEPNDPEVLSNTNSLLRSKSNDPADLRFMVFDLLNEPDKNLQERLATLKTRYAKLPKDLKQYVKLMPQTLAKDEAAVIKQETAWLADGYEGAIMRSPESKYANKRSSMKDQALMKLKRFKDAEAVLVDCYPLTVGCSAAQSIMKSGQLTAEQIKNLPDSEQAAAGYIVQDITSKAQFHLGTPPMTLEERRSLWKNKGVLKGKIVKYKYFPYGMDPETKIPRHATMIGFREEFDLPKDLLGMAKKLKQIKPKKDDDAA